MHLLLTAVVTPIFHDAICSSAFQSERDSGCIFIGGQNGDAIRVVPAKDRVANTEHEPLAFEC